MESNIVVFKTEDDKLIETTLEIARVIGFYRSVEESCIPDDEPIHLQIINSTILELVLEWCEEYKNEEDDFEYVEKLNQRTDDIPDFDQALLNVEVSKLVAVITAANFLQMKRLEVVACKIIANKWKAKNPEQLRETFDIENDFTPEKEEQIIRENNLVVEL